MKHIYLTLFALLVGMTAWADAPLGYAIYGDVPAGFTNLTSAIEVHNTSETFSDSPSGELVYSTPGSTITFTGSGNPSRICENKADLLLRFKADQPLTLTSDMSIHVLIRRSNAGSNAAQISFCRDGWNSHRMGWIIPADHLSQTAYTEIIFPYALRNQDNYNSWSDGDMIGTDVNYAGATSDSKSRDLFRFCGARGEGFEIAMIFITNSSPKAQSFGLGTLKAKGLPLFAETSPWSPTGEAVDNLNLYVVSLGSQVFARITSTGHFFDSGFADKYQFRTWKINHERNKSVDRTNKTDTEVFFESMDGLFGIGENTDAMVSVRAKVWGQSNIICSQKLPFRGTYVNTPTGDVTAPAASASWRYEDGNYVVTFTASDDSGELFYYVENTTTSHKQISMTPSFALTGVSEGDVIRCYAVDFDGNMSAPVEFTLPVCGNCFPVTF